MKKRSFLLIVGILLGISNIYAVNTDSILKKLPALKGAPKIDALNTLVWELKYSDNALAWKYAGETRILLGHINYPYGKMMYLRNNGALHILKADMNQAQLFLDSALVLARKSDDRYQLGKILNLNAIVNRDLGRFKASIKSQEEAIEIFKELKDTAEISGNLNNLAMTYGRINNELDEIKTYFEVFEIETRMNNTYGIARTANNLGMIFIRTSQYDKAQKYLEIGLTNGKKLQNFQFMASSYFGLAKVAAAGHKYDSAVKNYQAAIDICVVNQFNDFLVKNLESLANIYENLNDTKKARDLYEQALSIVIEKGIITEKAGLLISLGSISLAGKKFDQAITNGKAALKVSDSLSILEFSMYAHELLAKAYKETGNFQQAYDHIAMVDQLKDTIHQMDQQKLILEYQTNYELKEFRTENERLASENLLKNKTIRMQWTLIGVTVILVVLLMISMLMLFRSKQKLGAAHKILQKHEQELESQSKALQRLNATKDRFFSIIAHDLKNPFGAIMSMAELLYEQYDIFDDHEKKDFLSALKKSSSEAYKLLENLLLWSRSQMGLIKSAPIQLQLQALVDSELSNQKLHATSKKIQLVNNTDPDIKLLADSDMLSFVLRNLVSNSIKFTEPGGMVEVNAVMDDEKTILRIADTGIGMTPEQIQNLYRIDMNQSRPGTSKEKGTGLGLILCHDFVQSMNGTLTVESTPGKGSSFSIRLPA